MSKITFTHIFLFLFCFQTFLVLFFFIQWINFGEKIGEKVEKARLLNPKVVVRYDKPNKVSKSAAAGSLVQLYVSRNTTQSKTERIRVSEREDNIPKGVGEFYDRSIFIPTECVDRPRKTSTSPEEFSDS